VLHVGKKNGRNYNIVTAPDPWVAKMIVHHSKPGGWYELVFDGKDGWLVCRTVTFNVALIQRYTYFCFEDKY